MMSVVCLGPYVVRQDEPLATGATLATVSCGPHNSVASVATPAYAPTDTVDRRKVASETTLARAIFAAENWQACFEERAAIREYSGGFRRTDAELLAWEDTIMAMKLGWPSTRATSTRAK
jgi:hypothetical protein